MRVGRSGPKKLGAEQRNAGGKTRETKQSHPIRQGTYGERQEITVFHGGFRFSAIIILPFRFDKFFINFATAISDHIGTLDTGIWKEGILNQGLRMSKEFHL